MIEQAWIQTGINHQAKEFAVLRAMEALKRRWMIGKVGNYM